MRKLLITGFLVLGCGASTAHATTWGLSLDKKNQALACKVLPGEMLETAEGVKRNLKKDCALLVHQRHREPYIELDCKAFGSWYFFKREATCKEALLSITTSSP